MISTSQTAPPKQQLSELFGNYKAEWLRERMFDLFTQPAYLPDLEDHRPCVLVGGRGTGKTTALRSLSYEGRFAFAKQDIAAIHSWEYFGFYYRVDTNRVTAFQGPELPTARWTKLFGHYINLLLCGQVITFLSWYNLLFPNEETLSSHSCERICVSLCMQRVGTLPTLREQLNLSKLQFESFLNNLSEDNIPLLSMQGVPVDELLAEIKKLPQFQPKHFFFLIDEYENFTDEQQVVINTLIKHSGSNYSFKIGVRELGWRMRATLNPNEQLNSPADYVRINIADRLEPSFEQFAASICNQRLSQLVLQSGAKVPPIDSLLPELNDDEEARLLGVDKAILDALERLPHDESIRGQQAEMSPLEFYAILNWAESRDKPLHEVLAQRIQRRQQWQDHYNNYRHALLFTIRKGKSGIRKYYAGWGTFVQLSRSNIRYLLELVDLTLAFHEERSGRLVEPVNVEVQTLAAQYVGKKNLSELEGLSVFGANLTKLALGLGRVFQVLAQQLEGRRPEINQFHISETASSPRELTELITAAVMHLALVRDSGTKLDEADVRAYDYSLHPIFAPFFVFSYRRKRKLTLTPTQILGLVRNSHEAIRDILRHNSITHDPPLPEQLQLFEAYYGSAA
jgi:hypothetical protein